MRSVAAALTLFTAIRTPASFANLWRAADISYGQQSLTERTYFYVGGQYVNASVGDTPEAEYMIGQIYVEKLTPPDVRHEHPLLFIHGSAQTATNWLNTPDDREGWAAYFLRQGYVVYLSDQPQRGRSPWLPGQGKLVVASSTAVSGLFTAPEKVLPLPYPQAKLHTQWPGSGLPGDSIFDAFYASQVQVQSNATMTAIYNNHSYVSLVDHIGEPVILVTHSQGGLWGWQLGDARPDLIAGIVAIEPGARPFTTWTGPPYSPGYLPAFAQTRYGITDLAVHYDPPLPDDDAQALDREYLPPASKDQVPCILQTEPARRLVNLAKVPVLQIVGEASFQAPYSECVAKYLKQAGVAVDFMPLGDAGIHGNAHFSFMEMNNIEVAEKMVMPWLKSITKSS